MSAFASKNLMIGKSSRLGFRVCERAMGRRPYISIIIPAYNAEEWIADALDSCVRQEYEAFEVIVVDDGSTDGTHAVASRYADAIIEAVHVVQTANKGASAARNVGLSVASGNYVLFLDADDMLTDDALEILASTAERTDASVIFGAHCNFDNNSHRETLVPPKLMFQDGYANAVRCLWVQGSFLMKKNDLRWNESRVIWEGLEYLLDSLALGWRAAYTDKVVVKVRQHQSDTRISSRFDHFEPAMTGSFFVEQKAKLQKNNILNLERASALDFQILGNAYALLRAGQPEKANLLFRQISWSDVAKYEWYQFGSLVWAGCCLGPKLGARIFYYANKLLGRA
jgi:glycosyltransferase involved in cell wall biosynthesis